MLNTIRKLLECVAIAVFITVLIISTCAGITLGVSYLVDTRTTTARVVCVNGTLLWYRETVLKITSQIVGSCEGRDI